MYKTESVLGLIGSIIGAIFTFLCLAGTLISLFFYSAFEQLLHNVYNNWVTVRFDGYVIPYETLTSVVLPVVAVCAVAALAIAAASVILGFVGTAKLNRDDRNGGVLLIVGGALALLSVVGFIPFVLMLVGGIMAVSRRPAAAAQSGVSKAV